MVPWLLLEQTRLFINEYLFRKDRYGPYETGILEYFCLSAAAGCVTMFLDQSVDSSKGIEKKHERGWVGVFS